MELADEMMEHLMGARIWEEVCQKINVKRNVLKNQRAMRLNLKVGITGDVYVTQAMDRILKHAAPIMEQSATKRMVSHIYKRVFLFRF